MKIIETVREMQQWSDATRCAGGRVGFVPTMGALHEGHLDLVRAARANGDHVVVSIFVNPTQFGPNEDFDRYPRTFEADCDKLRPLGVEVVFHPSVEEMYPTGGERLTWVDVERLGEHWCGAARPGHFRGVTTVVTKLFNAVRPDRGYFGEKDFQQLTIIRRMNRELLWNIDIVGVPTRREEDGLAMSSRNQYLSSQARQAAVGISAALRQVQQMHAEGEHRAEVLVETLVKLLDNIEGGKLDYAGIADTETLQPVTSGNIEQGRLLCAVFLDGARLIDNLPLG
ncbi:MAG: pantoate--beta-alanine ligase [Candidatus Dadabacteria bacterium]|nr:MAG: pantoate--beta-alanine ligase [Candidatus Dadabacteria bacterium]